MWPWPHFSYEEMADRETGLCGVDPQFMAKLERIRGRLGIPMPVTSGYRKVGGTAHPLGRAADIHVFGPSAFELVKIAIECGMTGIGIAQKGPTEKRFIHLDDLEPSGDHGEPRPRIWSY